jgi:hypothetical protein
MQGRRRPRVTITTDGGTTFAVDKGQVTITRPGAQILVVPLADLREFMGLVDLENGDDDFEGDEP